MLKSRSKSYAVLIKKAMAKIPATLNTKKSVDEYYKTAMKEIATQMKAEEKTRRQEDKKTRRQEDKKTRRQEDKNITINNMKFAVKKTMKKGGGTNIDVYVDELKDIYLDNIYKELIKNGFYENIRIKNDCSDETIQDDSIIIPHLCSDRKSKIEPYKTLGIFIFYKTPCRIGRSSIYCSNILKDCKIIKNNERCPICNIINLDVQSQCEPLNHILKLNIISEECPLIIIPNAYPYLETQFLIVSRYHYKQIESLNIVALVNNLFRICNNILAIGKGVVFFNGICGNSLEHFHCQYTTTEMPLFNIISEDHEGIFNKSGLRGYSIIVSDDFSLFIKYTQIIIKNNLTYNFITRKVTKGLQIVLFIRNCKTPDGIKNLGYGATELSGIIVSNEELTISDKDIIEYLEVTNRESDYKLCFPQ
jgi:hypothetical protein